MDRPPGGPRVALSSVLLVAMIGIVVVLTWPLARDARTHLPRTHYVARTDVLVAGWALAWQSHALATTPLAIGDGNIFHPSAGALFYGPTGTGALPLFAPVFLATGETTLALNATLILGLALTAWTMALVVLHWTGSAGAALLAAWVLLTSAWLMRGMVPTAPFCAALFYFPLIIYLAAKTTRLRHALLLAPLVALQSLVDTVYVAPAVLAPLGILTLARLARRRTRRAGWCLAAALALALLLMSPVLAGYLAVRAANPEIARQTFWTAMLLPLPLPGALFVEGSSRSVPLFLLAFIAGAATLHLWRTRGSAARDGGIWAHGALWFFVGILVSLPPSGLIAGRFLRLPLGVVKEWIPALGMIRTHDRLGVAVLMANALLAGAAVATVQRALAASTAAPRTSRWAQYLVAPVLMVALYLASVHVDRGAGLLLKGFDLFEAPRWSAPAADVLRTTPGAVLEIPFPPLDPPRPSVQASAMYRSTQHWRPLINGHHSYYPSDFPGRASFAARVPEPDALEVLRREANLSLVAVSLKALLKNDRALWEHRALQPPPGLRLVHRSPDELLFEVVAVPGRE